jgi:hypothetical protein
MRNKPKTDTQRGIVVSKWLERMWEIEEAHPFVSGSSLSSKGWAPRPKRKTSVRKPATAKAKAGARKRRSSVAK